MCGICGIARSAPSGYIDASALSRMRDVLTYRGPDDAGTYIGAGIGLGIRRLSIIDIAGGHQPMCNEDRTLWIVFNGEIYNYLELRQQHLGHGHRSRRTRIPKSFFISTSSTAPTASII